jgi:hypothetical protein
MTTTIGSAAPSRRLAATLVLGWLLAGTLDITTALLFYSGPSRARAARLLQGIASGVLGVGAFADGAGSALLGLLLHYGIALIWTLVLFAAFRAAPRLRRHLVVTGTAYGVVVWLVMNLVVLPLSRVRQAPIQLRAAAIGAIILVACIGLPLSLVLGRGMPPVERRG